MRKYWILPVLLFVFALNVSADELGEQVNFNVDSSFDVGGDKTVKATLRTISNNAYFYISDEYTEFFTTNQILFLNSQLEDFAKEFEDNIYKKLTGFWGEESKPGVDDDPRITILITDLVSFAGGYFDTGNSFSTDKIDRSNERDMLYLNTSALDRPERLYEFVTHELQHLISINHKEFKGIVDDVWLNETRSEYSVTVAGYNDVYSGSNLERRASNFMKDPNNSLTEWKNRSVDYAQVAILAEYLTDKYGPNVLFDSLRSGNTGINSISDFESKYKNWLIANYLNDTSSNNLYGYDRPELSNFKIRPNKIVNTFGDSQFLIQDNVKDWESNWYEIRVSNNRILKLDFSGAVNEEFALPYIAFWNDGSMTTGDIALVNNKANIYSQNLNKIVLMPLKKTKVTSFSDNESAAGFNVVARLVNEIPDGSQLLTKSQNISTFSNLSDITDGSLIRQKGSNDIYVVRGEWKRYLLPEVIQLYGHLDASQAIEVSIGTFNSFKTSNYVRYVNEEKVYAIWPDGTKHWFNMSGEQFLGSGRGFDAIFIVNQTEIDYYRLGVDITR